MTNANSPLTGADGQLSEEQLLGLYRTMLIIRRTEEQLVKMYAAGKLYGGVHTYIGEEAVASGVCAHLGPQDAVFSTHRGHGHALAKGIPPRELIAELLGRITGCSQRPGRQHAPVQARDRLHGLQRHRGGLHRAGRRGRLHGAAAKDRQRERGVLRRRRDQQRRFPRGHQPRHDLGPAGALRLREQPLRDGSALLQGDGADRMWRRGRQRTVCPGVAVDGNDVLAVYQAAGEAVATGAVRWRSDPDRMPHLSHARPLRGHARCRLSHAGRGGRLAGARSAQAAQGDDARRWPRGRSQGQPGRGGDQGHDRGSGSLLRGQPAAGSRHSGRSCLCRADRPAGDSGAGRDHRHARDELRRGGA